MDFVKIGLTNQPERRIRTLASTLPLPIEVLGIHSGNGADEALLHARFRDQRTRGEWFKHTPEIERMAIEGFSALGVAPEDFTPDVFRTAVQRAGSIAALAVHLGCSRSAVDRARRTSWDAPRIRARIVAYVRDAA